MEYDRLRSVAKGLSNYQHYAYIFHKAPAGNDTVPELYIQPVYTYPSEPPSLLHVAILTNQSTCGYLN